MKSACFLDTNVLIYAAAGRIDEPEKHAISVGLLRDADLGLSGQVLAEFAFNMVKKHSDVVSADELDEWLEMLARFPVAPIDSDLVRIAVLIARRHKINYWDAALIAAAERLGAPVLYSEDLNDGQTYGSVRVVNPFRKSR